MRLLLLLLPLLLSSCSVYNARFYFSPYQAELAQKIRRDNKVNTVNGEPYTFMLSRDEFDDLPEILEVIPDLRLVKKVRDWRKADIGECYYFPALHFREIKKYRAIYYL